MANDDYDDRPVPTQESKRILAGILAIALGWLGVHKFVLGYTVLLAADPYGNGTPVAEGLFALNVPSLRAVYEIHSARQFVAVVGVSLFS